MMNVGALQCISNATFHCIGKFGAFVTFAVALYLGDELTVSAVTIYYTDRNGLRVYVDISVPMKLIYLYLQVFAAIGLFNVLAVVVGLFLPSGIICLSEMLVSITRIQVFLRLPVF